MIDARVRKVLAENGKLVADVASLDDDDDLYRYGLSSHATVNLMLALESEFDIEFPDEMLHKSTFATISAIRQAISQLGYPNEG
jgi:acyl carrier protein